MVVTEESGQQFLQRLVGGLQILKQFELDLLFIKDIAEVFLVFLTEHVPQVAKEILGLELAGWLFHLALDPLVGVQQQASSRRHLEGLS